MWLVKISLSFTDSQGVKLGHTSMRFLLMHIFLALLALKACAGLEEIVKIHCLFLLREFCGSKYSKTWNFKSTNKGFITVHNSFKKLSEHNDRHSHMKL